MRDRIASADGMPQSEVGGGARIDSGHGLQRAGYVIRDFTLNSAQGERIEISNYRRLANLVLVFSGEDVQSDGLLRGLVAHEKELKEQDAIPILILSSQAHALKNPGGQLLVLIDEDERVHALAGAVDQRDRPAALVYVTDRFGEIVSVYPTLDGARLPNVEEVLKLLEFINHQCPECEPPEWPL